MSRTCCRLVRRRLQRRVIVRVSRKHDFALARPRASIYIGVKRPDADIGAQHSFSMDENVVPFVLALKCADFLACRCRNIRQQ